MSGFGAALQKGLYSHLVGRSPAIADDRIYDDVPQNVTYPFVEIGDTQDIPDDTSGGDRGMSTFVDLHTWSRYRGKLQVKQIQDQLHGALHGVSLSIAGRVSALAWVRSQRAFNDADGVTRHGVTTVEIIHRS